MLYQLSYEVKSVRVGDISELSLVPSSIDIGLTGQTLQQMNEKKSEI
jgi:hypothetical protein